MIPYYDEGEFLSRLNQSDSGLRAGRCANCDKEGYELDGEWFHNDGFFSCTAEDGSLVFRPVKLDEPGRS